MQPKSFLISSQTQIWRALVFLTLAAIGASVCIAIVALRLTTSGDPNAMIAEHDIWRNVIIFSILTPGIVCPLVVYALLTTLRELTLARAELNAIAKHDPLTGLLNRRGFDTEGEALISDAHANRRTISAIICDIDFFKRINDTYGHDCGDVTIRHVAGIVKDVMDQVPDTAVGRQGGEEFAVLLTGVSIRELTHYAETIRYAVESSPLTWQDTTIRLTISLGTAISTFDDADANLKSLLTRADKALYLAKNRGRNRVEAAEIAEAA